MKVKLHVLYGNGVSPELLTDEEYQKYKKNTGNVEKQNAVYDKDGKFMWFVLHREIEVDTESAEYKSYFEGKREGMKAANLSEEYDEGYNDGYKACEEDFLENLN